MKTVRARISRGGQISVPGPVRRRWATERVAIEDHGDHLVVRPLADPVSGFVGFAAGRGPASDQAREQARAEERAAEQRRRP
jgi:bifunctional DNA-binding transcriptional regulator/antitoxin component of YhaV-PrlF toxin-antitoxin module